MPNQSQSMPYFASLLSYLLVCATAAAQATAESPATTARFSLELTAARQATQGYFPMGFVRGEPSLTVPAGFSQVQEASMFSGFVQGAAYPAPSPYLVDPWNLRYYSLALPADSIEGLLMAGAKAGTGGTDATKRFGAFTLARGPDGLPYALPEFKSRDLAKVRDLVDVFDAKTRRYLLAYVKAHVESRVNSPLGDTVSLWGLDNEWEAAPNYSPVARGLFLKWLESAYANDIAALNTAWRTHFTEFNEQVTARLPAPGDYRTSPGAFLDWYAFSTDYFLHVMLEQARTMQAADPRKRGVVHKATQLTLEMPATRRLRLFDHGRFAELIRPYSGGLYGIDIYGAGDRQAYETNFIFNCIRPEDRTPGYGVMLAENNNHSGPGHQFASTTWRLLANGVKSMMFFTPGFAGAPKGSDWDTFAMIDRGTGLPKDRWFYAARWAAAVHRTEAFWTAAVPAAGLPRVAMLVPGRDILLAERSDRSPTEGRFAYPRNHRWMVYRWLREQGYWVDVLPYEKITDRYLQAYSGLVLVGAEHLSATECETVARYVAAGGVLVGDTLPGYFDQHHRVLEAFAKPAGLRVQRAEEIRPFSFEAEGYRIEGVTAYTTDAVAARVLARDGSGQPLALLNTFHDGRILSLPFELGSLVPEEKGGAVASVQSDNAPTAGTEQYDAYSGEFAIGRWLADLLVQAGLNPSYRANYAGSQAARIVRVEQPFVDAAGNVAVVIANRAQLNPQERLPAGDVEMPLPGGTWTEGWWAPAESETLVRVKIDPRGGGLHGLALPEIASAGVLYLFKGDTPLLGAGTVAASSRSADGVTPRVAAGATVVLPVQLVNTTGMALGAGSLRVDGPMGWTVMPGTISTPVLAMGAQVIFDFTVTLPPGSELKPGWPEPLTIRWHDGAKERAVITTQIEGIPEESEIARLLTGNATYPASYPYRLDVGATYRYLAPVAAQIMDPAVPGSTAVNGRALVDGFGSLGGERNSFNRGGYVRSRYARYAASKVEVIFDLQATREIARVNVVCGPEPVLLKMLQVLTSDDGVRFSVQRQVSPAAPRLEQAIVLPHVSARFVKLLAEWPGAGGTLDEVEIWGR